MKVQEVKLDNNQRRYLLLDDTKRKTFDKAIKQGIFSFDESDKLKKENNGEIPSDIIDMLYTNHKLNLKRKIKRLEEENKELKEQIKVNYVEIYKQL